MLGTVLGLKIGRNEEKLLEAAAAAGRTAETEQYELRVTEAISIFSDCRPEFLVRVLNAYS